MLICVGCGTARHRVELPAARAAQRASDAFLDLREGYRLRVITPLTKSGSFLVKTAAGQGQGQIEGDDARLEVTQRVDEDFLGYETSYYLVSGERRGLRIRFASAERMIDGKAAAARSRAVRLFEVPRAIRVARLLFLVRQSESDHDMAFVGARSSEALDSLTEKVRGNPAACQSGRGVHCEWIPAGIAVRAEARDAVRGWEPVR